MSKKKKKKNQITLEVFSSACDFTTIKVIVKSCATQRSDFGKFGVKKPEEELKKKNNLEEKKSRGDKSVRELLKGKW